ncbi:hypothetical protein ACQJBY_028345 [Aegilops geniculata]
MGTSGTAGISSTTSLVAANVDGVGIVQFQSEFYIHDLTFCGLEVRSSRRCPGHGLIPARRVAWGGASSGRRFLGCPLDLPDECDWVVWIDPPSTECVGRAFEELHAGLEKSWLKAHYLERRVMYLTEKNKKLKLKMKKRNEVMQAWGFIIVLGFSMLATFVSGWSNNPY